ncbi:hypothetical protein FEK30_13320 [Picosynechococcus sp. PCC 11901]|uniref:hypothetical protein n=1 Tax=Picosynechococcus sp. PCC 11901 TaxID=2579791 RepID=UPI0010FBDC2A|nr:hypothetical protein [Picosynechococcus sp. PCC 11901]QCS50323.1 hypothetical protein FEK30_13320 [Picosynechococcus sp. PCC 11901]
MKTITRIARRNPQKGVWRGVRSAFSIHPPSRNQETKATLEKLIESAKHGAEADTEAIRSDWKRVGRDMYEAQTKFLESLDQEQREKLDRLLKVESLKFKIDERSYFWKIAHRLRDRAES